MERLGNNIIKLVQRPRSAANQRLPQHSSAQDQRRPSAARYSAAEQNTRTEAVNRRPESSYSRSVPPQSRLPETLEGDYKEPTSTPSRPAVRPSYQNPRTPHPSQYPRYDELPPQGDYYDERENFAVIPSNIQEDWGDDTVGMHHGDWESAPCYYSAHDCPQESRHVPHTPQLTEARSNTQEISPGIYSHTYGRGEPLAIPEPYHDTPENIHPAGLRPQHQLYSSAPEDIRPAGLNAKHQLYSNTPENIRPAGLNAKNQLYSNTPENIPPAGLNAKHQLYSNTPENIPPVSLRIQSEPHTPVPPSLAQTMPAQHIQRSQQRNTQPLKTQHLAQNPMEIQKRPSVKVSPDETEPPTVYIPPPYKSSVPVCSICKGAGYLRQDVPYGHPGFGKPVQCQCKQKDLQTKRRLQRRENSNLRNFMDKRFDNFNPTISPEIKEAYRIAKKYAQDPGGWLILIGKVGCGKTHLAAAIANEYIEYGETVLFTTTIDLLDHLRSTFAPSSDIIYDQLFAKMREASLLVLDDLGTQQSSPWANEKLFQLLNYRYNLQLPTVITTNIVLNNIEERIRSRMMDASFVRTVVLDRVCDYRPRNPRRK
jgi:DNA replication protein DnaC